MMDQFIRSKSSGEYNAREKEIWGRKLNFRRHICNKKNNISLLQVNKLIEIETTVTPPPPSTHCKDHNNCIFSKPAREKIYTKYISSYTIKLNYYWYCRPRSNNCSSSVFKETVNLISNHRAQLPTKELFSTLNPPSPE